jgi:pyrroloquinoline-quinone synthase
MPTLESSLQAAVEKHDLLCHPFYQAWSMGTLRLPELARYAAQYRYQVQALPSLLRAARDGSTDAEAKAALQRNLDEEEGREGPAHAELWDRFAAALQSRPEAPQATTRESAEKLEALCAAGEVEALAALWTYEMQTARVSKTKYGVSEHGFFALHEQLDVHHAGDLLAALERRCGTDSALLERAIAAARKSAQAQWRFLDGFV